MYTDNIDDSLLELPSSPTSLSSSIQLGHSTSSPCPVPRSSSPKCSMSPGSRSSFLSSSSREHSGSSLAIVKGKLQKKGAWAGWTEAFFQVQGGMLFEFKNEISNRPVKVMQLAQCQVQLAENLTGKPFSFVIHCPKQEDMYLRANDETKMVEFVSAIGSYCVTASVQWGTDSFLEAFVDAVVISSEDGTIVGVNQKTCEMFGYEKHELMGRCVEILTPPHITPHHAQYMMNYIQSGEKKLLGKPRNVPVRHKNGDIFRAMLSLGEKEGENGNRRFIATLRSEHSFSQDQIKDTICSSVDASVDSLGKAIKDAVMTQMADVFDQLEQLKLQNKQLASNLAQSRRSPSLSRTQNSLSINLDNLIVQEKLATTGGSGATVYSCLVDGFRCAMKELRIDDVSQSDMESFAAEIVLLEKIPFHKNVVRYLFHTKDDTTLRLFMTKYVGTLSRLISKKSNENGLFSISEVAKLTLDVATGLEVLHNLHIIHRDVKSENIFYSLGPDGSVSHLAIGDLDTAKVLTITKRTCTVVGTPSYMAPEVLMGRRYSYEVDVWSLGMVMFELMTLQRPYSSYSVFQVSQMVTKGELPAIPEAIKAKYGPLLALWEQCVQPSPAMRPALDQIKPILCKLI